MEPSLQPVLTSCGATPKRMAILDQVASVYAGTGSTKQSALAVDYAYQKMQGLRANGETAFTLNTLKGIYPNQSGRACRHRAFAHGERLGTLVQVRTHSSDAQHPTVLHDLAIGGTT